MDAATYLVLTTFKHGASICAVFQIKGAGAHRAKDIDSTGEVINRGIPISSTDRKALRGDQSVETAKERALTDTDTGQANEMPGSPITLHKVIEGVKLTVC